MTNEAKTVLRAAVAGDGRVRHVLFGRAILPGGVSVLPEDATPRDRAFWVGALEDLHRADLLLQTAASESAENYRVTHEGYEKADVLGRERE